MKRSHTCGELNAGSVGKEVCLQGWVNSTRDHGGVIFIDLRDRYGITQVVFDPAESREVHEASRKLRREDVIEIKGTVRNRPEGTINKKLPTGEIEVLSSSLIVLNKSKTPPFEIDDRIQLNEDIRLKYRYLDLRKGNMQKNLMMRHKVTKTIRDFFDSEGFLEIETPVLAKSTPEGARDYLVPSRVHPGSFFALPQSPQIYKQILMVSGFDRYMQIVKCFRDEDLRADRQPEFTQIDVEMSFIEQDDLFDIIERMISLVWREALGVELKTPFPRMSFSEAMARYGSDKPDTRFGLELADVSDIVADSEFQVFRGAVADGGNVKALNAKDCASFSRKDIDGLIDLATIHGAKGMAWIKVTKDGLESSIVKFLSEKIQAGLVERLKAEEGDLLLFVADKNLKAASVLGQIRLELGKRLGLIDESKYNFLWIVDFPMFEWSEEEDRFMAMHHPFTSPRDEDIDLIGSDPGKALSKAYDITLNGVEIGGGSIRIHRPDVQKKVFSALGISEAEAKAKFGFLLDALKYGAPPHGGIALGLDRMVAIITKNESIREVIAFPKNKACQSLMEGSPSEVDKKQLKELHIDLDVVKKN